MELNPELVTVFDDEHKALSLGDPTKHNIFKLTAGLCHGTNLVVLVNGEELDSSKYVGLYPSSEFAIRYGIISASAVMLLDNSIVGNVVVQCRPIGGIYQYVDTDPIPTYASYEDSYGVYLETIGEGVFGLETFSSSYNSIPSRATDIDGILVGETSYPTSTLSSSTVEVTNRLEALELKVYHEDLNIPTLIDYSQGIDVTDRSKPLIQLKSENCEVTYYYEPSKSEISINLNPMSGEIIWIDPSVEVGTYEISIYIMSNGIRSDSVAINLNILN